jgi:hypothetical protein
MECSESEMLRCYTFTVKIFSRTIGKSCEKQGSARFQRKCPIGYRWTRIGLESMGTLVVVSRKARRTLYSTVVTM